MTEVENLILDHLRHVRGAVDALREDMREVKTRLDDLISNFAGLANRFEGLDAWLARLERRLGVIERHC
jgi:hypothetical protein